jgi:hypothetical protein
MMPADATPPEPAVPPVIWELPNVRDIAIRRGRGEPPPQLAYFRSSVPDLPDVVEFEVVLDGPLPARAMPPVLYVGETPVFQRRADPDTHRYVFQAAPDRLRQGEEVTFGWLNDPPQQRKPTGARYQTP